jgi:mannitol 2-dehydrogenase
VVTAPAARLSEATLDALPAEVGRPAYDRSEISVGIVHLGAGGFHRSHQAMHLARLMSQGDARDWGICAVGTLQADRPLAEAMLAQGGLYTLAEKRADGSRELQVIGSIVEYLFAPDDVQAVIERMTDPRVRVVSLTVTEGGYFRDFSTGEFDASAPAIRADGSHPETPQTVFGMIAQALARRRARGTAPFAVMSCDNIPGNGEVARAAVAGVASLADAELGAWIASEVAFPNSMVDRITPRTTDDDRRAIEHDTGLVDGCPVVCEPFFQWVLEDRFPEGRPPLERAGVQLVDDVEPYELMKLRLLNATHQAMCYFGSLIGYHHVHEAVADPDIALLLRRYMREEGAPTLPEVPGIDLDAYQRTLLERYGNPEIRDTLARLCADASDRIPNWLVPVVQARLAAGERAPLSAAVIASWARYCEGVDDAGRPIEIVDARAEGLVERAARLRQEPTAFLKDRSLFGDLIDHAAFVDDYRAALAALHTDGAAAALSRLVQ